MFLRLLVNAAALAVATALVPGITLTAPTTGHKLVVLLVVALVFGVVNTLVKPLVKIFAFPFIVLTLGLFLWVVNALMLLLTSSIAGSLQQGFHVAGLGAALVGSLVVSVVSYLMGAVVGAER